MPAPVTKASFVTPALCKPSWTRNFGNMQNILPHLGPIVATFLMAGLVKGVIGLGLPTVAMGLLGLVMPPAQAAALLIVPSLVTNFWQLLSGPRFGELLVRLQGMMVGICLGTWAGSGLLAAGTVRFATPALGAALMVYAVIGLTKLQLRMPHRMERWAGPLVGVATGLVTGATGVFVIPAVPYLGALGLERNDLVQALGLSFTVSTVALAAGLAWHGALPATAAGASLLALIPAMAGMAFGGWLRDRVQASTFRLYFFLGLLVLGGELIWRGMA
jgi:uncharacterized protein